MEIQNIPIVDLKSGLSTFSKFNRPRLDLISEGETGVINLFAALITTKVVHHDNALEYMQEYYGNSILDDLFYITDKYHGEDPKMHHWQMNELGIYVPTGSWAEI